MKNSFKLFRKLNYDFRLLIGKKYILDNDTNMIHNLSHIKNDCKIENIKNIEYLSNERCVIYETYDFIYEHCEYCKKKINKRLDIY